jgi:hypothetical protein
MLCGELTRIGRFEDVSYDFLVAGHTKFYPDIVFATIAIAIYNEDVVNQWYECI